jgi:hypothetical protein
MLDALKINKFQTQRVDGLNADYARSKYWLTSNYATLRCPYAREANGATTPRIVQLLKNKYATFD